jgi:HlyD family secretion protein
LDYRSKVEDLMRNIKAAEMDLQRTSKVVSTNAGRVVELKVYPGAIVGNGEPIVSIEPLAESLEAVVFVPSSQAKEIKAGMEVDVSPSGIQREEYGYLLGHVRAVNEFPATLEAITRTFENESLARSMLDAGPVTELRVSFVADSRSYSGYKWSSAKGPPATISSGAVCSVEVVTREQAPVSLVLPYLKKQLGL